MSRDPQCSENPSQNLQGLINSGEQVCIGEIGPVPYAAVAADRNRMYAALSRCTDERLVELLTRLDVALDKALFQ
jgi:hypothetical protein